MPLIQCSNILSNWDKSFFGEYEKQDVLYIVTNGTEHKIGISSNIYSRYQSYRTNSPKPVKLEKYFSILNVRDIETLVHRYLKNLTIDSRSEWTDIEYDELESYLEKATLKKAKRTIFMTGNG